MQHKTPTKLFLIATPEELATFIRRSIGYALHCDRCGERMRAGMKYVRGLSAHNTKEIGVDGQRNPYYKATPALAWVCKWCKDVLDTCYERGGHRVVKVKEQSYCGTCGTNTNERYF